jgi:hypothetical protein
MLKSEIFKLVQSVGSYFPNSIASAILLSCSAISWVATLWDGEPEPEYPYPPASLPPDLHEVYLSAWIPIGSNIYIF